MRGGEGGPNREREKKRSEYLGVHSPLQAVVGRRGKGGKGHWKKGGGNEHKLEFDVIKIHGQSHPFERRRQNKTKAGRGFVKDMAVSGAASGNGELTGTW